MNYQTEFEHTARTALSMWNRDPASPSYGSFDRAWWGWKFKDFPDATLQYAARIAVPFVEASGGTPMLREWLEAWVRFTASVQHSDGSFDQAYPYERTPGVIYDILSTLIGIQEGAYLSEGSRSQLRSVIEAAAGFALRTDEQHGEIANHIAEYAYELAEYARHSNSAQATSTAAAYVRRLLSLFNREEGWFREYEGPDTGYQTRTLRYVVKLASLPGYEHLWDVAARAGEFLDEFIMPDGSVHPMLGTRSTALLYPSGIEALARRHPERFAPLAARVRRAWGEGLVPTPSSLDFGSAIRLADDAREAAASISPPPETAASKPARARFLVQAGLAAWRTEKVQVFVSSSLGGALVVYSRQDSGWRLAQEDSGYLFVGESGSWLTRMPGAGVMKDFTEEGLTVEARFARVLHDELSPARMILLRLLNLTLLRSQWLGDLFRKVVVGRLMSGRSWIDLTLSRRLTLEPGGLRVDDIVAARNGIPGRLSRPRRATGAHMASARYFQSTELLPLGPWETSIAWDGRRTVSSRHFEVKG